MGEKKRRGGGEGSIYRRKDGRWVAVLNLGYEDGKRRRVVRYARTRREAAEALREMQRQQDQGINLVERQTVGEFLDRWLVDTVVHLAQNTRQSYQRLTRLYLKPYLGRVRLAKLTPDHVQHMVSEMTRSSTVANIHCSVAVLKSALSTAVRRGYVPRNVASLVSLPRMEAREPTFFTVEQAHTFLEAAQESRFFHLYQVALGLGLRQHELLELTWGDVDFEQQTLHIRKSKTRAGRRRLALPDALMDALKQQRQQVRLLRLAAGVRWRENDLVFPTSRGKREHPKTLRSDFKRCLGRAGLPDIRFHDLRHSCASFLMAQQVPPKVISEILGHSNIAITMNTYTHVLDEVQREAVERVARMLTGQ